MCMCVRGGGGYFDPPPPPCADLLVKMASQAKAVQCSVEAAVPVSSNSARKAKLSAR